MKTQLYLFVSIAVCLGLSACSKDSDSSVTAPTWVQDHATLPNGQVVSELSGPQKQDFEDLLKSLQDLNTYVTSFQQGRVHIPYERDFDSIERSKKYAQEIASCRKTQSNQSFSISGRNCSTEFQRNYTDTNSNPKSRISGNLKWFTKGQISETFDIHSIEITVQGERILRQESSNLQTGVETLTSEGRLKTRNLSWDIQMSLKRNATNQNNSFWNENSERLITLTNSTSTVFLKEILTRTADTTESQYYLNGIRISDLEANKYLNVLRFFIF
jgi:hypothetical protein